MSPKRVSSSLYISFCEIRGHRVFEPSFKNENTKKKPAAETFVFQPCYSCCFSMRLMFVCFLPPEISRLKVVGGQTLNFN